LEGTPAIVGGVLTYFLLPSCPQEAKFLTADEKEWIRAELGREEQQKLEAAPILSAPGFGKRPRVASGLDLFWHDHRYVTLKLLGATTGEVHSPAAIPIAWSDSC